MVFRKLLFIILMVLPLLSPILGVTKTPTNLVVQANLSIGGIANYSGGIKMDVGLYKEDIDDPALWKESFSNVNVVNGAFSVILGQSVTLNAELFESDNLRIGFTPYINGEKQPIDFTTLKSVPYSFHSEISSRAERLTNEQLIKLDETNMRVGINNLNPQYTLDVVGTVNASTFVGDGSLLTNIQVSDERLVWLKSPQNQNNIYYTSGNVGIHTKNPSARLEVSGNVIASGNLNVNGTIMAKYLKGDGSQITNMNADQIALGTLHSNRLSGNYTGISGIGTITTGIWKAKPIEDAYIDNELTLNGASLTGTNLISGNIRLTGPTVITGNQSLAIASPSWNITADGDLTLSSVLIDNTILVSKNIIQFTSLDGFHIKPNVNQGLFISPTGSVGINTTTPSSKFHVNGGIRLGDTDVGIDGMLRFKNDKFEGYRDNKWVQLDYEANFDSHALHAEGDQIKNLIYVTSAGNVGIGGIPSPNISDHLTVSGNVIFKGRSLGTNQTSLNVAGNGTRMFWYPKKTAFRAGYVDTNEWDDANIGVNSVVFGHSGKASGAHTTIIGGRNQINQGESSVIIGGYSNEIKSGSNYSVIIGGGSATGGGNLIDGGQYSTILGGQSNKITGDYSTILGGLNNTISGDYSAALGSNINIGHNGTFIFSDGQSPRASSADYQFLVYASGNVGIGIEPVPDAALNVGGKLKALAFEGDGSLLTNISATKLSGYAPQTTASPNSIYISDANGYLPENSISGQTIKNESITSVDIKNNSITGDKIMTYAITTSKIMDGAITSQKIASGAITSDKIQNDAITSKNIKAGSIASANIAPGAVKTKHIANLQVTNAKIALDTIDTTRIVDATITSKDIALGAIASINIAADAIQSHHIAKRTIISDNIKANAIQAQHLNDQIVSSRNIANNAIYSSHIANYNILSTHISSNAIQAVHIADDVITNSRIFDNSIKAEKIAPNGIEERHLPDKVIISRHIADNAVLESHIASGQIPGSKLANNAIASINIADNAITASKINANIINSSHIIDGTITSQDIGISAIPGSLLAENAITSKNIAVGGIASFNLQNNSISSDHIIDFSITSADIKDETIDAATALVTGSVTSEKIKDGAIENKHIANGAITSKNISDGSLPWDKITTDPIPASAIGDNTIPGTKLKDGTIPGSKLKDKSVTSDKLADNSISTNALVGVLPVDKGGTGMSNLAALSGAVVYGTTDGNTPPKTILGADKTKLSWDATNTRLGINVDTPLAALHVKGDIFTESGGVFFGTMDNSISFGEETNGDGFIIIGPEATPVTPTTKPNGTLKTNKLYVLDKVGIGVQDPLNTLDIGGTNARMAIGSGFAGTKQAPVNGLIVEGNVGIATDNPAEQLSVEGTILAKEIIGKATDGSAGIGIKGIGGNIGIQSYGSDIGIDVMATQTGVKVTSTGSKGISVVIKNASDAHQGIYTELKKPDGTLVVSGGLGKLASDYAASIYGAAPDVAGSSTNWAGLFDGPIKVSGNLGIGLLPSETPEATLHVKGSALIENQVYRSAPNIASSTTINWSINNKHSFNCSSGSNQNLTFQDPKLNGNYVDASFLLTLVVTNSNADCSVTFSGSTIKWEKGESPASGDTKGNGKVFLFHFFAQTTKSPGNATYYAYEPSEFSL